MPGALKDLTILRQGASKADGVIHTAFGLDISKIDELAREDNNAIGVFGEVFAGSDRPIIVTSGVFMTPPGEAFKEDARPSLIAAGFPRASEQKAFALADRGLRASVVPNPRSVHGEGESHGFVPMLAAALAMWVAGNGPASSEWTRKTLGWEPREVGLIAPK